MCPTNINIFDNEWNNKLKVSHGSDKIGKVMPKNNLNKVIPKNKYTISSK